MVDSNGMAFFELLADVARYGGGYLYYVYPNPDQNMTEQVKLVYVESIDDTWFIGSGIYLPHIHAKMEEDAISELIDRVLKSVEFAKIEGKEKASSVFNDINSTWAKDSSYIFAYDFTGATLAMPYQPEAIGEDRWEYTDRYGSPIARLEIDVAKRGGGFVYVVYYNPDTKRDELKLCYVLPVDNDWLVGSGLYTGDDLSVDSLSG
jgi:signal transduction histidine kinase